MEKLWEAILAASRVTEDPVKAWAEHNANLKARCDYLNSLKLRSLHYTADNGTDLTVGLIPEGAWRGGGDKNLQGIFFNPNIPTEECFISPKRGLAEGIVYSSMCLCSLICFLPCPWTAVGFSMRCYPAFFPPEPHWVSVSGPGASWPYFCAGWHLQD